MIGVVDVALGALQGDLPFVLDKNYITIDSYSHPLPSFCGRLIRLLMLGRFCGVPVCAGLREGWIP